MQKNRFEKGKKGNAALIAESEKANAEVDELLKEMGF
jgi:hypothetical protein